MRKKCLVLLGLKWEGRTPSIHVAIVGGLIFLFVVSIPVVFGVAFSGPLYLFDCIVHVVPFWGQFACVGIFFCARCRLQCGCQRTLNRDRSGFHAITTTRITTKYTGLLVG